MQEESLTKTPKNSQGAIMELDNHKLNTTKKIYKINLFKGIVLALLAKISKKLKNKAHYGST